MNVLAEPQTTLEVAEAIRDAEAVTIRGSGHFDKFSVRATGTKTIDGQIGTFSVSQPRPILSLSKLHGILDFRPEDQVVSVRAGTSIYDLQNELVQSGLCIPVVGYYDTYSVLAADVGTVGGTLSMNIPEHLDAEFGTWKDWILGVTVVLADGTICKSGSHAVKSVAGYDIHKLMVGARGSLGIVTEVILRLTPEKSVCEPTLLPNWKRVTGSCGVWIQRTSAEHFEQAFNNSMKFQSTGFPKTNTIWVNLPLDAELPRFPGDWVIRSGCADKNVQVTNSTQIELMKKAKQVFDPMNKLNPGEWGFM